MCKLYGILNISTNELLIETISKRTQQYYKREAKRTLKLLNKVFGRNKFKIQEL